LTGTGLPAASDDGVAASVPTTGAADAMSGSCNSAAVSITPVVINTLNAWAPRGHDNARRLVSIMIR
jgi:hypothetical protein